MAFVAQNWFYIVVVALFVAMHLVGFECGNVRKGHHHSGHDAAKDRGAIRRAASEHNNKM